VIRGEGVRTRVKRLLAAAFVTAGIGGILAASAPAASAQSVTACVKINITVNDQTAGTGEEPVCVILPPPGP
jgi:hypothetical protein